MKAILRLVGTALLLAIAACAAPEACTPPCMSAKVRLVPAAGLVLIPIEGGGQLVEAALDTGAFHTTISSAAATALDARIEHGRSMDGEVSSWDMLGPLTLEGVGGSTGATLVAVDDFRLAGARLREAYFYAVPDLHIEDPRIQGFVGGDLLQNWDLDLDIGSDTMALDLPQRRNVVPPWQGATTSVALLHNHAAYQDGQWIKFPVELDGHRLTAILDTGASRSLVSKDSAAAAELLPGDRAGAAYGLAGRKVAVQIHHFRDLSIAGHSFGAIDMGVGSGSGLADVDMLLGLDFLSAFRVYVAYQAHVLLIENDTP